MIPKQMETFLKERLPERTWQNRLQRENGFAYMEFGPLDVDRLARMNIEVDSLGPRLVVCMWDEENAIEVGGYLVVDNLAMGTPSMGGIRMLPDLTPSAVHNLARGMTLKNAAANLPYGGGKSGIVARHDHTPEGHTEIMRLFARMIYRYRDIYLPGPDVGTNDADMKTIAIENGIDNALSKPSDMGGNRIDELGAAAASVVIAIQALLDEMPRLRVIPQFANLEIPEAEDLTFLIQGFGAVGANAAKILNRRIPGSVVVGISDLLGYLFDQGGLPTETLFEMWLEHGLVTRKYYTDQISSKVSHSISMKYGTEPNDLLRESAFCLIPAAPIANYLDTDWSSDPCMTVDCMGLWSLIVEGANTYSPDPERKMTRARMERSVYRQRGVLIATDYLVNSGGVIYAAQERLIKTPDHLRFPEAILGNRNAVEGWLLDHSDDLEKLAEKRRVTAEAYTEEVIQRNMKELLDLLISDADMLPCEAAEMISVQRIARSESVRTVEDIMEPIPTVPVDGTVQQAAEELLQAKSPILAVVSDAGDLVGVITEWDITRAVAIGCSEDMPLAEIMTTKVIKAAPQDGILIVVRNLEQFEISAMPVVDDGKVLGMVSADLLARRSLLRLLQTQSE
ncbi:MAG: CBS domain-containing protein [Anaerolineales bacterium]|nr:CBS domain-containing protein [Anaerolineales bacterium]